MVLEAAPRIDFFTGDMTNLRLPAHGEALRQAGAETLTVAMQKFGALAPDNRVTAIAAMEPCAAGSTGQKFFLTLHYARAQQNLPEQLFVKFSRDFTDPFRDHRRGDSAAEINLAALSRHPDFPIAVPRAALADFHSCSGTGLVITERIGFGEGGIEPLRAKCMDHELADPLEYYRTILRALAKLAAAHKTGRLSPELETLFPFDPAEAMREDPIPYDAARIAAQISRYGEFAATYKQLIPPRLATQAFLARLQREALDLLRYQDDVRRHLYADPASVAFSHFNTNLDNAWFWRDAKRELQCGLLDWQRARQMNLGAALWGGLSAAPLEIWHGAFDDLLGFFIDELHAHGGPRLDPAALARDLRLYAALMGLTGLFNTPAIVLRKLPEAATAIGPRDLVFARSEAARSVLHMLTILLDLWERHDIGADLAVARGRD